MRVLIVFAIDAPDHGKLSFSVAHDEGVLFMGITVGNSVVDLTLLAGLLELFGSEAFRHVIFEDSTRQCQPMPKIIKESFVIQRLETCFANS